MGISTDVPLLQVDATDDSSLQSMVDKTKVVLTTVGTSHFVHITFCALYIRCHMTNTPI